jgi:hypothetical protein
MEDTFKLYGINLTGTLDKFNPAYVIATDPDKAYRKVREWLDKNDYGFTSARELETVHLVAEASEFTNTASRLFLPDQMLSKKHIELMDKLYGVLWMEAHYDPSTEATKKFATPLSDIMAELNKDLKFKP